MHVCFKRNTIAMPDRLSLYLITAFAVFGVLKNYFRPGHSDSLTSIFLCPLLPNPLAANILFFVSLTLLDFS